MSMYGGEVREELTEVQAEDWGGLHNEEEEENVLEMHLGKGIEQILGYGGRGSGRTKICISGPGTKSRGSSH